MHCINKYRLLLWIFGPQVAIICNHQRSISKSHEAQMTKLQEKIDELKVTTSLSISSYHTRYLVPTYIPQFSHRFCKWTMFFYMVCIRDSRNFKKSLQLEWSWRSKSCAGQYERAKSRFGSGTKRKASPKGCWWKAKEELDPRSVIWLLPVPHSAAM